MDDGVTLDLFGFIRESSEKLVDRRAAHAAQAAVAPMASCTGAKHLDGQSARRYLWRSHPKRYRRRYCTRPADKNAAVLRDVPRMQSTNPAKSGKDKHLYIPETKKPMLTHPNKIYPDQALRLQPGA